MTNGATETGIDRAIKKAGGQAVIARTLGVTQQAVSYWKRTGYAPLLRAVEMEMHYGIPRSQLISPRLRDLFDDRDPLSA